MKIGTYEGREVHLDTNSMANSHMGIIGRSGEGKTSSMVYLANNIVSDGGTVLVVDGTGDEVWQRGSRINIISAKDSIPIPLLSPISGEAGVEEDEFDMITKAFEAFDRQGNFGCAQGDELKSALQWLISEQTYAKDGIKALDEALELAGTRPAYRVRDKLRAITRANLFVDGDFPLAKNHLNYLDLHVLPETSQRMVADVILSFIKRKAWLKGFADEDLFIFVDEVKHYLSGREAVIPGLLAEGRKYGLNIIWATQCLSDISDKRILGSMMQACCVEFFRPADNEVDFIAKKINGNNPGDVARRLRNLRIGSCLAVGTFSVGGRQIKTPLPISIPLERELHETSEIDSSAYVDDGGNQHRGTVVGMR